MDAVSIGGQQRHLAVIADRARVRQQETVPGAKCTAISMQVGIRQGNTHPGAAWGISIENGWHCNATGTPVISNSEDNAEHCILVQLACRLAAVIASELLNARNSAPVKTSGPQKFQDSSESEKREC